MSWLGAGSWSLACLHAYCAALPVHVCLHADVRLAVDNVNGITYTGLDNTPQHTFTAGVLQVGAECVHASMDLALLTDSTDQA